MLITFEGTDFAGKTTQINRLYEKLPLHTVKTREPGGTPMAEKIRDILKSDSTLSIKAQFALFRAARQDHIEKIITKHPLVLCDRYIFSSYAYQQDALTHGGWNNYFDEIKNAKAWPNITLFFRTNYETFLKRSEGFKKDVLENVSEDEFNRRRKLFEEIYNLHNYKAYYDSAIIDTDNFSEDEVEAIVKHYMNKNGIFL